MPDPYINSHGYDDVPANMIGYSVPQYESIDHEEHSYVPMTPEYAARIDAFESGAPTTRTEPTPQTTLDQAQNVAQAWQDAKTHAQQQVTHEILNWVPQFLGGNLGKDPAVKTI